MIIQKDLNERYYTLTSQNDKQCETYDSSQINKKKVRLMLLNSDILT